MGATPSTASFMERIKGAGAGVTHKTRSKGGQTYAPRQPMFRSSLYNKQVHRSPSPQKGEGTPPGGRPNTVVEFTGGDSVEVVVVNSLCSTSFLKHRPATLFPIGV